MHKMNEMCMKLVLQFFFREDEKKICHYFIIYYKNIKYFCIFSNRTVS